MTSLGHDDHHGQVVEDDPQSGSTLDAIRYVGQLHGSFTRPVALVVLLSASSGVVEAAALVAFVRAAIEITTDSLGDPSIAGVTINLSPGSLLLIAIVLACVAALLHVLLARASVRLGEQVAVNSRARLIRAFLDAQWSYVARYREGQLQEAMSGLTANASRATTHLAVGISSIVIIIALGIAALVASPLVSAVLMALPVIGFALARPHLRRLRRRANSNVNAQLGLSEATSGAANLVLEYRTTGTQDTEADRLTAIAASHSHDVAQARTTGFTMTFLFQGQCPDRADWSGRWALPGHRHPRSVDHCRRAAGDPHARLPPTSVQVGAGGRRGLRNHRCAADRHRRTRVES
jgi:ABC-type multidrug transport system fused ATPase/permease subunit